jgi:zinc transport system substrate-binding protein
LAIQQVANVAKSLTALYPVHAALIEKNKSAYTQKLTALRDEMTQAVSALPDENKNLIVFHEAFPYFAHEFKMKIVAVIEREPGQAPSAKELKETIALIKKHKIKAIFVEPQYSSKPAQTLSKETGVPVYTLDPAVSGAVHPDAYLNIMRKNLATLVRALK